MQYKSDDDSSFCFWYYGNTGADISSIILFSTAIARTKELSTETSFQNGKLMQDVVMVTHAKRHLIGSLLE